MPQFKTRATFEVPADAVLSVIADVDSYAEFIPGIVSSQVAEVLDEDAAGVPLEYDVEVSIGLSIFNGKLAARVERDPERRTMSISLARGPIRRADCRLEIRPLDNNSSEAFWEIDYDTPSPVIDKLIGLYRDAAFNRAIAAFQDRAREVALQHSAMQ
ncbi:MAG: SRPBCC family protein [Caulobacterales bacterium]|nr:SRPBCC family protein [Caulobacterales bacterium]